MPNKNWSWCSWATSPLLQTNMFYLACLLSLLLLTYQLVVQAADVIPHEEVPTTCVDGCSKRTLFNIIWGCLSTTIICAWAAVHPNIPPQESYLKRTLRRLELMLWTIIAPEILPTWAVKQLLAARIVRDVYNEGKGVFSYLFTECASETKSGHMPEKCGFWNTLERWFSFYEIQEVISQGGYVEWYL